MNYYLEGYQDALAGYFDARRERNAEYKRGWDAAFRDNCR